MSNITIKISFVNKTEESQARQVAQRALKLNVTPEALRKAKALLRAAANAMYDQADELMLDSDVYDAMIHLTGGIE